MSIYDTLNDRQKQAVMQTEGPVLILAGAGSGKTRVLTHRVAYLIDKEGVNPYQIMAITFTNKAAGEMRERVDQIVGFGSEQIWVSTFHSTCVRILRRYIDRLGYDNNFTIYDTDDQKGVMKEICKKLQIDTKTLKERTILSAISSAKDELIDPVQYEMQNGFDYNGGKIAKAYKEYQAVLHKNNALDFDDLIMKTVELFKADAQVLHNYQERFRYIMVDEYQDTNTAQFELIRLLADRYRNLCVVGDDDQSIYKFRGANIRNILDFEKVYPEACVIKLEQNYRSTQIVLDAANAVIKNNRGRKDKALWTEKTEGNRIHLRQFDTAYEEAEYIAGDVAKKKREGAAEYGECAVLYRTNAQARLLEERFIMEGVPYDVIGGTNFYARREIKDVLAYLKTIDNGRDDVAVKRIINVPKRGIGMTTIVRVQEYADARQISFYDALREADQIMTIGRSASKLKPFVNMIQAFRSKQEFYSLSELVKDILETTGYVKELEESDEEDAADRIENIDELISKVTAYEETHDEPTLSEFLEEVALVADIDRVDGEDNRVLLMTLHSAKGLEFPHVYLAGLEDGIFPSYMTIMSDDPMEVEEERRLAYVGITRAKDDLTITYAKQRMIRGETQYNPVSRFIREIPAELMDDKPPVQKRRDYPEYDEDSRERSFFKDTPYRRIADTEFDKPISKPSFGKALGGQPTATVQAKPKAIVRPKRTAIENQPYISRAAQGIGAVTLEPVGNKTLAYGVGDRVRHMRYGEGTVLKIEAGPRDSQVTVVFDEAGQKIMYAGFAKLTKV
ncbi:MAG: UvrD-helicase domain-containing protein [Lachnospiraceae bacterium]|nr:UvrD-helicase domain-containing protein [Lachnospiraceae bacterium]